MQRRTIINRCAQSVDAYSMVDFDTPTAAKPPDDEDQPQFCVVCGKDAVTIDRTDTAMCAKHAAMFITREHREAVADRARIVR